MNITASTINVLPIELLAEIYMIAQPTISERMNYNKTSQDYNYRFPKVVFRLINTNFNMAFNKYAKCKIFKYIRVDDYKLTDVIMKSLVFVKSISLSYKCDGITFEGIKNLPLLKSLYIRGNHSIQDCELNTLTNLTRLGIFENSVLTNEGLSALSRLQKLGLCGNLKIDRIPNPEIITALYLSGTEAVKNMHKMTSLKTLNLHGSVWNLQETDMKSLTSIVTLDISDVPKSSIGNLTNTGLSYLTNVKILNISSNTSITSEGLLKLTNMTSINIQNSMVTKKCLERMTRLINIRA